MAADTKAWNLLLCPHAAFKGENQETHTAAEGRRTHWSLQYSTYNSIFNYLVDSLY